MVTNSDFAKKLGVKYPILLAPMGGGPGTPELVAAVSNSGGLGSLAAAYLKPDQISKDIQRIRKLTDRPFAVNLFAGGYDTSYRGDGRPMLEVLAEIHQALDLPAPSLPDIPPDPFNDQFEVILDARPSVFSFTFGIPAPEVMARLKANGVLAVGTATTVDEAVLLEQSGVAAIVAQGAEAGAHRGTFLNSFDTSMVPTLELVRTTHDRVSVPVIASGSLMDGRDIAESFACGASAAQLGTAFLTCPESGTSESYRNAIVNARVDTTVVTRAFSGRPARGLSNTFITRLEGKENVILPYPVQNILTRPMRNAAAKKGESGFQSLWAGQGVPRSRSMPAGELVQKLVGEMKEAGVAFA